MPPLTPLFSNFIWLNIVVISMPGANERVSEAMHMVKGDHDSRHEYR